jgi:hypothetical protein
MDDDTVILKYEVEVMVMKNLAAELQGPLTGVLMNAVKPYTEGQKVVNVNAVEDFIRDLKEA